MNRTIVIHLKDGGQTEVQSMPIEYVIKSFTDNVEYIEYKQEKKYEPSFAFKPNPNYK